MRRVLGTATKYGQVLRSTTFATSQLSTERCKIIADKAFCYKAVTIPRKVPREQM